MKAFIFSLALAFIFATGAATAGNTTTDGEKSGCGHQKKWEDT
ncbi:MAG: hypothetical protein OEO19_02975 [Gammaproteobacteria bacterium]|nr:hypothetical protein [Gammaproteobacteria bacterium]MDH3449720.1 hypothetical protein [Gammaproteobacteria bacterium]